MTDDAENINLWIKTLQQNKRKEKATSGRERK